MWTGLIQLQKCILFENVIDEKFLFRFCLWTYELELQLSFQDCNRNLAFLPVRPCGESSESFMGMCCLTDSRLNLIKFDRIDNICLSGNQVNENIAQFIFKIVLDWEQKAFRYCYLVIGLDKEKVKL